MGGDKVLAFNSLKVLLEFTLYIYKSFVNQLSILLKSHQNRSECFLNFETFLILRTSGKVLLLEPQATPYSAWVTSLYSSLSILLKSYWFTKIINADVNGALNILRKVAGDSPVRGIAGSGYVTRPVRVRVIPVNSHEAPP